MWIALCDPSDAAGLWTVAGLRRLGLQPLEVVLPQELVTGALMTQRLGAGGASVRLKLRDGRLIRGDELRGVLNRLPGLPSGPWAGLAPRDRDYVAEELNAMLAGLLFSLSCPVLNPPDPSALGGETRTVAQWRVLAAHAGLAARDLRLTSWDEPDQPPRRALASVVGTRVIGVPLELVAPCLALAAAAGLTLLGLSFEIAGDGRWLLDGAFPQPDLRPGGHPALEALVAALRGVV